MRASVSLWALLVVSLVLAGCRGGADKAGGARASKVTVLTLAISIDGSEVSGFAAEVNRLSQGRLQVHVQPHWRSGQVASEQGLINDVRAGKADLGAVGSRAWDTVGVTSFRALGTPLLIDSYALQDRVLQSPLIAEMLSALRPLGLVGLAVLPGPMRRPVGTDRALLAPSDYSGLRIGLQQSFVASAALRALGAIPVVYPFDVPARSLDGVESHLTAIQGTHEDLYAKYLTTNVVLWARPLVIFATRQVLSRLTPAERAILRQAAADDLGRETKALIGYERSAVTNECAERRLHFVAADTSARTALRRAMRPVYAELARDPRTRRYISEIETMRTQVGASASAVPACEGTAPARSAGAVVTALDGVYKATVEPRDLPVAERLGEQYGTWEIVLDRGRFRLSERSDVADWVANGDVVVRDHTITWRFGGVLDWGPHGAPDGVPLTSGRELVFNWRRDHGALILTSGAATPVPGLLARPLSRVGDAPGQQPLENSAALQGVWTSNATAADVIAHHDDPGGIADNTGPLRLTLRGNRCRWTQRTPNGLQAQNGMCRFAGDTLEFDAQDDAGGRHFPFYLHWSVFHDRLTVREAIGATPEAWTYHPWRRVP